MSVYDGGCELGGTGRGCRCKAHKITLKTLVEDMDGFIAGVCFFSENMDYRDNLERFDDDDIFQDRFLLYDANINL